VLLKGCLNGTRSRTNHPACPVTPDELARDAADVVAAGIATLHVHPRDEEGRETLAAHHLSEALAAIRAAVSVPVGVTTGAWFVPEPVDRLRLIEQWEVLPDFASVNFHEEGAVQVAHLLLDRGVGVEAGLWHKHAAAALVDSGLGDRCMRVLLEPMEQSVEDALANVTAIEQVIATVNAGIPRLLHGCERTAWPLLHVAAQRGYEGRIGLEDTLERPDGGKAASNGELATIAARLVGAV
jgi:uncharacterized protein (DUF849 family)